jgi:valyl-tRNA synthetase
MEKPFEGRGICSSPAGSQIKLDPKRKVAADCGIENPLARHLIEINRESIERLASLSELRLSPNRLDPAGGTVRSTALFDVRIVHGEGIDKEVEIVRLRKEIERLNRDIDSKQLRLGDMEFRTKAPQKVIQDMIVSMGERQTERQKLKEQLARLQQEPSLQKMR